MSEESLDPRDWNELRALGHRMLDDMLDHLAGLREKPVWQPVPDAVQAALHQPLPREGQGAESVYEEFRRNVMPYPNGNLHPRFFGWVQGSGTPLRHYAFQPPSENPISRIKRRSLRLGGNSAQESRSGTC